MRVPLTRNVLLASLMKCGLIQSPPVCGYGDIQLSLVQVNSGFSADLKQTKGNDERCVIIYFSKKKEIIKALVVR